MINSVRVECLSVCLCVSVRSRHSFTAIYERKYRRPTVSRDRYSGSRQMNYYAYVDNTERERQEAEEKEERRLKNERKLYKIEERMRVEKEQKEYKERLREELRQQRQKELEQEERWEGEEEQKRVALEADLSRRRKQLFDYKFGEKTKLDSFLGLHINDVTQLRIGVFGPAGSGKSSFINTCERAVRQTEKGSAPVSSSGMEETITLQHYLPEMFFHLVDTRCFFNYNSNENIEFQNILFGKIQPGDDIARPRYGKENTQEMHECPAFEQRLHGVIIVVKANDPRLTEGAFKDCFKPVRYVLSRNGIAPITVLTHKDNLETEEDEKDALDEASAATGSSPSHTFLMRNYTKDNSERNSDIERMTFDILHCALMTAERAVKIMKQKEKNRQEDEMMKALDGVTVSGQVAPDSADASVEAFLRFLQKEYQWSTISIIMASSKLAKDDITSVKLLALSWREVLQHFPTGMSRMIEKELKKRGIAPVTVITHSDQLKDQKEKDEALEDAYKTTRSSPSNTFFICNYTKENSARNPEIERMTFDILHYALITAEKAVKQMKLRESYKREDEMMKVLKGVTVSGQVAPDSPDASVEVFLRFLQEEYRWSTTSIVKISRQLVKDDITTVSLLAKCWSHVQDHFPSGMSMMIQKELKKRGMLA